MGKSGGSVYDILLSIDYGICHGPVDRLNRIRVKEERVYCGDESTRVDIPVNQPELFGGDSAEGGVVGTIEFYPGDFSQVASDQLATRAERTVSSMPGYKGLCHAFFRGNGSAGSGIGFRWQTNNPYMPGTDFSVSRMPQLPGSGYAEIWPPTEVDDDGNFVSDIPAILGNVNHSVVYSLEYDNQTSYFGFDLIQQGFSANNLDFDGAVEFGKVFIEMRTQGYIGDNLAVGFWAYQIENASGANVHADSGGVASEDYTTVEGNEYVYHMEFPSVTNNPGSFGPDDPRFFEIFYTFFIGTATTATVSYSIKQKEVLPGHCDPEDTLGPLPDANPAHIIYEILTNADWGKGEDPANIDESTFVAAAQTLHGEWFGLSFEWSRQTKIEDFISEVLDHIQAMLFVDPETGKWTLKLLRDDYSTAGMREINPGNATIENAKRTSWGNTINEIIVAYTDPENEKDATVSVQDLAAVSIQGGIVSEKRAYRGVRNEFLAKKIADRDVRQSSFPKFAATIYVDRAEWNIRPGDVRPFSWPEDGIGSMIIRIMSVDYGGISDRRIKLEVMEDFFALDQTTFVEPQKPEWQNPNSLPQPLSAQVRMGVPMPLLLRNGRTVSEVDALDPEMFVMFAGTHDSVYVTDIEAHTSIPDGAGGTKTGAVTVFSPSRTGFLPAALVPEATSTLPGSLIEAVTLGQAAVGFLLLLGEVEATHEFLVLWSYDSNADEWTVARGVYDTLPLDWPSGQRLWPAPLGQTRADPTPRPEGNGIIYRLLPRMSGGRLDYAEASDSPITPSGRPFRPFRPADCQIESNGFGKIDLDSVPATVNVSWANRNRTTEDQQARLWTDGNVTPESGQTTTLEIVDYNGVVQHTASGLTGTSHAFSQGDFASAPLGTIRFVAVNSGGDRSLFNAEREFDFVKPGYGNGYGFTYGN